MSMLQMQIIGEQMKAHFIVNFTDGFHKIIWNLVKYLGVMLTDWQAWHIGLYGCLCKRSKYPLAQKRGVVQ